MNPIERLQHFVGRPCTILTRGINRDFINENPHNYPELLINYFTGIVESVDEMGIMMKQLVSTKSQKTYFFLHSIVGIAEEEQLDPNNPDDAKAIEKIKTKTQEVSDNMQQKTQLGQNLNAEELKQAAQAMKDQFGS